MATPASNIETLHERTRILVVEDEPIIRLYIAEALREMGAVVIEAGTADEAWAFLTTGADVDLVFTDHRMPGAMSGAELATRSLKNRMASSRPRSASSAAPAMRAIRPPVVRIVAYDDAQAGPAARRW